MFLWNFFAFSLIQQMLAIWSPLCLFQTQLVHLNFSVHILLPPGLKDFEHNLTSIQNEYHYGSLNILWHCPSLGLGWKSFPDLWPLLSFPNLLTYWVQHFNSIIFYDCKNSARISITSTSFVRNNVPKVIAAMKLKDAYSLEGELWPT